MTGSELNGFRQWFSGYCKSFLDSDRTDPKNYLLKEEHTLHVCENMREIALDLGLDPRRTALAEAVALFHDVGRFPQYQRYRTFRDSASANHAALSAAVLIEQGVLAGLPSAERGLVVRAVALHNVFTIPGGLDEDTLLLLKMVRDADKLDIWRVFIRYYTQRTDERPTAVGLDLPDTPDYSPDVIAALSRRETISLSSLRTLNDFKLLQLAWIFDLNFTRSLQLVRERSVIDQLAATLPRTADVVAALDAVRCYVDEKLNAPCGLPV